MLDHSRRADSRATAADRHVSFLAPRRAMLALSNALVSLKPRVGRANAVSSTSTDPKNRTAALAMDATGWTASMDEEILNHGKNESWEWIARSQVPSGRHLVKLVWVFKTKRDGRKKSRLCVQGCAQTAGIDYDQTFSAALHSSSLRMLSSMAAHFGLRMRRFDFVAAYLQGSLEDGEVVYCLPPPGYSRTVDGTDSGEQMVCKVVKPVYGMAQAGRRWQRTLFPWLEKQGFVPSESEPCIFTKFATVDTPYGPREEKLILGVYVDDLATIYSHDDEHSLLTEFVTALQEWNVEDEGELTDLLGIDFSNEDGVISLVQTGYIDKLVRTYLPDVVPRHEDVPCDPSLPLLIVDALEQDPSNVDPNLRQRYQSITGALLYCATNTRPDVAFSVALLCRAMARPTPELLVAAERVLCYLHSTRSLGLRYAKSDAPLFGMSDDE